jgi:hypothetical protein
MQTDPAAYDTKPGEPEFARLKGDTVWKVLFHPALRIVTPISIHPWSVFRSDVRQLSRPIVV